MSSHSLVVRPKWSQAELAEPLGTIGRGKSGGETGVDILSLLGDFFGNWLDKNSLDQDLRHLITVQRFDCDPRARIIEGILESGEYGYESYGVNVQTRQPSYRRSVDDAGMLPFYFFICAPLDVRKGLVLLQRFKGFGMSSVTIRAVRGFCQTRLGEYTVDVEPIVPHAMWHKFLEDGGITQLTFKKHHIPTDLADQYADPDFPEVKGTARLVLRPVRNGRLPFRSLIERFRDAPSDEDRRGLLTVEGVTYDDATVQLQVGKTKRTLSLGTLTGTRGYFDVDNDVDSMPSGHPTYESLQSAARKLAADLQLELGWKS